MTRVNVAEAKAHLSELIEAALRGEDVVIARRNTPVVRLTAVRSHKRSARFGMFKGRIRMSADFAETPADFADYVPPRARRRSR
ncbi:MAG: type II toxin-antitoxin system Phd/YefM family antitoxin [Polyangiales bacterium]